MTKREAAIVAAYTGVLIGDFDEMHAYIEKIMGGPVFTHQMGLGPFMDQVREKAKPDFIAIQVED